MFFSMYNHHLTVSFLLSSFPAIILATDTHCDVGSDFMTCQNSTQKNADCKCDSKCVFYGDCCMEAVNTDIIAANKRVSCEKFGIYVIRSCSTQWQGMLVKQRCELNSFNYDDGYLNQLYVLSNVTKRMYGNIFCAICNYDIQNLIHFESSVYCADQNRNEHSRINSVETPSKTKAFYNKTAGNFQIQTDGKIQNCSLEQPDFDLNHVEKIDGIRFCARASFDSCPPEWTNETIRRLCLSYVDRVLYSKMNSYKNYHCALCNEASEEDLKCENGILDGILWSPVFSLKQVVDVDFTKGNLVMSEAALCDLSKGQVYDPLKLRCVEYGCPELYSKDELGKCNLMDRSNWSSDISYIEKSCKTITREKDEFTFVNQTMIYINFTQTYYSFGQYEIVNGSAKICINENLLTRVFSENSTEARLSLLCLLSSIVCLLLHLTVYAMVPQMRTESGKLQINLTIALLFAHISFTIANTTDPGESKVLCLLTAISMHYFFLASFFWMNVLAFDVWYTFAASFQKQRRKKWKTYLTYAWGVPGLILLMAFINEKWLPPNDFQPWYGRHICWISQRKALFVFLVLELFIITITNLILFVFTLKKLQNTKSTVEKVSIKGNQICFKLYLKLAVIMGLTWAFGLTASVIDSAVLWYIFMTLNGLQGVFMFVAFGCRKVVIRRIRWTFASFWVPKNVASEQNNATQSFPLDESHNELGSKLN